MHQRAAGAGGERSSCFYDNAITRYIILSTQYKLRCFWFFLLIGETEGRTVERFEDNIIDCDCYLSPLVPCEIKKKRYFNREIGDEWKIHQSHFVAVIWQKDWVEIWNIKKLLKQQFVTSLPQMNSFKIPLMVQCVVKGWMIHRFTPRYKFSTQKHCYDVTGFLRSNHLRHLHYQPNVWTRPLI